MDRVGIDFDFNSQNMNVKDGYIHSTINDSYIKNPINSFM